MPDFMVFRAVTPPGFDMRQYQAHSNEPIRFDSVTVVEADEPGEAIDAVIAATGLVTSSFFAIEGYHRAYGTGKQQIGEGGKLRAPSKVKELEDDNNKRVEKLEKELDQLHRIANSD